MNTINSLYVKLCDINFFTTDTTHSLELFHASMKDNVHSLGNNASSSSSSYNELTFNQTRLAKIIVNGVAIRHTLALIQLQLLPHIEIIQKVISVAGDILNRETIFLDIAGFIYLAIELKIQFGILY